MISVVWICAILKKFKVQNELEWTLVTFNTEYCMLIQVLYLLGILSFGLELSVLYCKTWPTSSSMHILRYIVFQKNNNTRKQTIKNNKIFIKNNSKD